MVKTASASVLIALSFFSGYMLKSCTADNTADKAIPAEIKTTGDTDIIKHSDIKQTARSTSFTTTSTGAGSIRSIIPTPDFYHYTLLVNYSISMCAGVEVLYRYDRIVVGAGINTNPDIFISAGVMF